jgi:proteasome lid subunit RPN8/RPN11
MGLKFLKSRRRIETPKTQKALICESAQKTMLAEVIDSPVETGGVMVGIADPPVIVSAGAGGEKAIRRATMFKGDTDADLRCLTQVRERFGEQCVVVGDYHKHPNGMSGFSGVDLRQAQELADEYADGKVFLVGIFAEGCPDPQPNLFLYGIHSNDKQLKPVEYEIVSDDDPRVLEVLRTAAVVPSVRDTDFWHDAEFRFYENSIGRARINDDLDDLRQHGWAVQVSRVKSDNSLRVSVQVPEELIELRLPPEYPLNPPRVFLSADELTGLQDVMNWNSERSLTAIVAQGLEIASCPRCRRRHLANQEGGAG